MYNHTCIKNKNNIIINLVNLKLNDNLKILKYEFLTYNIIFSLIINQKSKCYF